MLINNCEIDISKMKIKNDFWVRRIRGKTTLFNETHRVCSKCNKLKKYSDYPKDKTGFLKTFSYCKSCDNKRRMVDYENNKEHEVKRILEWKRKDRLKYPEKYKKANRSHNDKNKEKYAQNYQDNKEKIKQKRCSPIKYNINKIPLGYESRNNNGILELKCFNSNCNNWHKPLLKDLREKYRADSIECGFANLYCSEQCKQSCYYFRNHSVAKEVKAFKSRLSFQEYIKGKGNRVEVSKWFKNVVLERDNYTCQHCKSNEKLNIHHNIGVTRCPSMSEDIANCITLCEKCHNMIHHRDGCTYQDYRR